nr:hypothetical protein CFP56_38909 [Quercus suber]
MLQDAAVQSATSLMAAMSDMLRSPQFSAHLSAHQSADHLLPVYGRPRSHTAPSTPLVEAPHVDPVELAASNPLEKPPMPPFESSIARKVAPPFMHSSTRASLGRQIERPRSSPQASTYPAVTVRDTAECADGDSYLNPPVQTSTKIGSRSAQASPVPGIDRREIDDPAGSLVGSSLPRTDRPTLTVVQKWPSKSPSIPGSTHLGYVDPEQTVSRFASPLISAAPPNPGPTQSADSNLALVEQISRMRCIHEAHLKSLKDCHERELQSNRLYIEYLEQRCTESQSIPSSSRQVQGTNTSHVVSRESRVVSEAPANQSQALNTSRESQDRTSQEAYAEVETLKRTLSACRKAQIDYGEIRRERDHFRESWEKCDRRSGQLKDAIKKAKDNEKALQNAAADLEARLVSANNERTDVLEGFHQACRHVKLLADRELELRKELADLQSRCFHSSGRHVSDTALVQPGEHLKSLRRRDVSESAATVNDHSQKRVQQSGVALRKREVEKRQLELEHVQSRAPLQGRRDKRNSQTAKIAELEMLLADQKSMVKAVQAEKAAALTDCAKYNSLLHAELRRQGHHDASQAGQNNQPLILEAEPSTAAAEKTQSLKSSWLLGSAKLEDTNAVLEKELQHCIEELIRHKLEIKDCKTDLTAAYAQLEKLTPVSKRPPTPEGDIDGNPKISTPGKERSKASPATDRGTAGLGIAYAQPPQTPTRLAAPSALSATSVSFGSESFSPKSRTPLSTHKKLPKPPSSQVPSPSRAQVQHVAGLHRAETVRSLSDSIISSYAKRTPVMPNLDTLPQGDIRSLGKSRSAVNLEGITEMATAT